MPRTPPSSSLCSTRWRPAVPRCVAPRRLASSSRPASSPPDPALDREQLGISINASLDDLDIGGYVAGGAVPGDVESITYTFSDGHVEEAIITDDMWAMAYFVGGRRPIEGVTVAVTMADGSTDQMQLRYPLDFCNQSNQGC